MKNAYLVTPNGFALSITRQTFTGLTGLTIINPAEAINDPVLKEAWVQQSNFLDATADAFEASDYNFRELVKAIVLSHYFRANNGTSR